MAAMAGRQDRSTRPTESGPRGRQFPGLRVVIAEDEAITALHLKAMVADLGHRVCAVEATADGAVASAGRHHPDVVLMDIRLAGGGDGVNAACRIRHQHGIRSLFVTADTDAHTRERLSHAEPLGVLDKPCTMQQVAKALRKIQGGLT